MTSIPSLIIFINGDITYTPPNEPPYPQYFIGSVPNNPQSYASNSELVLLQQQLFIDDTMTKAEFDARIAVDPNYPTIVHLRQLRILVILPTFQDLVNREFADVVAFIYQGQVNVEWCRFGPPAQSINLQRITIYDLINANHQNEPGTCCLPPNFGGCCCQVCGFPWFCDRCRTFSGIQICLCSCECRCGCNVHWPNQENEFHNCDFINRK